MHDHYSPRETMRARLERELAALQEALADPILDELNTDDLEWTRLPNGDFAWLRPDTRYVVTNAGHEAIVS